jgi:hypothetical protein
VKPLGPLVLLLLFPGSLAAWTPAADARIASKGALLAPPGLKIVLDKYAVEYRHGLELAEQSEGVTHDYFVLSRSGALREQIERETAGAILLLRTRKPLAQVVERLGVLAHLVADANNPLHVANDDPRLDASYRGDFDLYFESRFRQFPTVFYGLDSDFQLGAFLDRTFARGVRFYPLIGEEYFRFGERRSSADFDDRSTAFGVASVAYSHAVTDLVNLYYFIWREAGGDVRSAAAMKSGNLVLNGD